MAMTVESLLEQMKVLVTTASEGDEPMSDEDAARYEDLERDLAVVRRHEEIRARQTAYETPIVTGRLKTTSTDEPSEHDAAFNRYLRTGDKGILAEYRDQTVGTTTEGGFTVPESFRTVLVDQLKAFGGVAAEAEVITTSSGETLTYPTLNDTANEGEIAAEGAAGTAGADLVFGEVSLGAFKYVAHGADATGSELRVSVELLQDSAFDVAGLVARKLGMRIARKQAEHWVLGTGTTQPEGITNPAADVTLATTSTVVFQDLLDVMADVDPAYVGPGAKWYMNNATLFHIRAIQDLNNRPLWLPQQESGMTTLPGGVLLGHAVVIDQDLPNHNTLSAKAIVFGDLRQGYIIRRVKDVTVVVDPFTRASEGQVVYTAWARADGAIQQKAAFSILANNAV